MKKILTLISLIVLFWISSAQVYCNQNRFDIKWDSFVTTNQVSEYIINDSRWFVNSNDIDTTYTLWKDNKKLDTVKGDKFFFNFENEWQYTLKASLFVDGCSYNLYKDLDVFYKSVFYIGYDLNEFSIGYENNFKNNAILFNKVLAWNSAFSEEEIYNSLIEKQNMLNNADTIIVNDKEIDIVFQVLSKLSRVENVDLSDKDIFVINNTNKHLMKRILSKYTQLIKNDSIYIMDSSHLLNLLSDLSFGKDVLKESLIEVFPLSFQKASNKMVISYIIDVLIANGFPINLIGLFLTIATATLVVTVFRQIIWFSVFWTFSPLLFGLSIFVLWLQASLIFFAIAFIATVLTRLITKKFYLLHSAKISLLVALYFMSILLILSLDKIIWTNIIDFNILWNAFSIFPIIFLIFVTDKVFHDWFKMFSRWWLISLIEFILVSWIVYLILNSIWIKSILLSYPELIILILLLIVFVGRFTWLQLLEYMRFMPILKGDWDEEE